MSCLLLVLHKVGMEKLVGIWNIYFRGDVQVRGLVDSLNREVLTLRVTHFISWVWYGLSIGYV